MSDQRRKRDDRRKRASARDRANKHQSGGWTTFNVPSGVSVWNPQAGTRRIDILEYEVGKNNPMADQGFWHYERTFWVHRDVGPNHETYCCPAKNAQKRCPICELAAEMAKKPDVDKDTLRAFYPKERQLFQLIDLDDKEKGIQLWEFSYHNFGKKLDSKVRNMDEDDPREHFAGIEDGKTLKVLFEEESGGGYSWLLASDIDFYDRKKAYDFDEIKDQLMCLDDILIIPSYEDLKKAFLQGEDIEVDDEEKEEDEEEEEEEEPEPEPEPKKEQKKEEPKKEKKPDPPSVSLGDKVKHSKYGVCEVVKISADGTLILEDAEGELVKGIPAGDVEVKEEPKKESKKEEPPFEPDKKKEKPKKEQTDEADENWDDEWD